MEEQYVYEKSIDSIVKATSNKIIELWFHMLKWDHQRHIQSPSWSDSINKQSIEIREAFENKNVKNKCIKNIHEMYKLALDKLISEAVNHSEYLTSKPLKTIPNDYNLDYILDDINREKWIHSRCGNPLLKSSNKFKYDTIKEVNERIDPKFAIK